MFRWHLEGKKHFATRKTPLLPDSTAFLYSHCFDWTKVPADVTTNSMLHWEYSVQVWIEYLDVSSSVPPQQSKLWLDLQLAIWRCLKEEKEIKESSVVLHNKSMCNYWLSGCTFLLEKVSFVFVFQFSFQKILKLLAYNIKTFFSPEFLFFLSFFNFFFLTLLLMKTFFLLNKTFNVWNWEKKNHQEKSEKYVSCVKRLKKFVEMTCGEKNPNRGKQFLKLSEERFSWEIYFLNQVFVTVTDFFF